MIPIYRLDYTQDYIEVFDTTNKQTVYVAPNDTLGKKKAIATITKLRKGISSVEGLTQYD